MKKIFLALALILSVQVSFAQVKTPAEAKKAVTSAKTATDNPKKAAKFATWIKLGKAYMDAYNAPAGNAWIGASEQELQIVMSNEKSTGRAQVELGGQPYTKVSYSNKDMYYNANGQLEFIMVTRPAITEDALACALEAYSKAFSLDVKGSKKKDILAAQTQIVEKLQTEAYNAYKLEDFSGSSIFFEKAFNASQLAPMSKCDSISLYNAGMTAYAAGDVDRAYEVFSKCREIGYYYDEGDVYAKLSILLEKKGQKAESVEMLKEGFSKYPQSQGILVGLINYYIESGENQDELFALLDAAKVNEPNNASLYYVEGNIHKDLGNRDKALAAYAKCAQINPEYEYGEVGAGLLYYNEAVAIAEKASTEFDDAKYSKLIEEYDAAMLNAIVPFENAYAISKDESVKVGLAEYLKSIYYRYRDKGADYQAGYEKYDAIVKSGKAQ